MRHSKPAEFWPGEEVTITLDVPFIKAEEMPHLSDRCGKGFAHDFHAGELLDAFRMEFT